MNRPAFIGFVLSMVSLAIDPTLFGLAIAGIVLGIVGLAASRRQGGEGKAFAISAIAVGGGKILLFTGILILFMILPFGDPA